MLLSKDASLYFKKAIGYFCIHAYMFIPIPSSVTRMMKKTKGLTARLQKKKRKHDWNQFTPLFIIPLPIFLFLQIIWHVCTQLHSLSFVLYISHLRILEDFIDSIERQVSFLPSSYSTQSSFIYLFFNSVLIHFISMIKPSPQYSFHTDHWLLYAIYILLAPIHFSSFLIFFYYKHILSVPFPLHSTFFYIVCIHLFP